MIIMLQYLQTSTYNVDYRDSILIIEDENFDLIWENERKEIIELSDGGRGVGVTRVTVG